MNVQARIPDEIERARSALWSLSAACPHDEWIRAGMAAKAAGLAFDDWDDWSGTAANYPGIAELRTRWRSFKDGGGVNAGTLFHMARQAGWQDPAATQNEPRKRFRHDPAKLWKDAPAAPADHPYIIAKSGTPDGLRVVNWPLKGWAKHRDRSLEGWLVVPVYGAGGELSTLQLIGPQGGSDKLNLIGNPVAGTFTVGTIEAGRPAYAVEGIGHAWSVNELTHAAAVVGFGSSGLERAARVIQDAGARPVLVADRGTEAKTASAAAACSCAWVSMPEDMQDGQDINDLHRANGPDEARAVLRDERQPDPVPAANDNAAATPLEINLISWDFPHQNGKGGLHNTPENLAHMLRKYGIEVAYNVIAKDVEITIPSRDFGRDNATGNAMATIAGLCARNGMPQSRLPEFVTLLADGNRRNPVGEWVDAHPWDGNDRFRDLALTLDPADPDLAEILLRRWMIGAAAAAFTDEGVSLQGALVLQGPQGTGKTSWFWTLAGGRKDLAAEGVMLNPADRDSVKGAISKWLVELGELDATFRKADIAALKSFLTRSEDELRLPYAKAASTMPRRTAFLATVNDKRFLRDETGNRRYWTIETGCRIDARHDIDVQQVWAQAAHLWRQGEPHPLQRDEMALLNAANEDHMEVSPIEELIAVKFDWSSQRRERKLTAAEVLVDVGYDRPNRAQASEAGVALRKLTGSDPRRSNGKTVFGMPPKIGDYTGNAF